MNFSAREREGGGAFSSAIILLHDLRDKSDLPTINNYVSLEESIRASEMTQRAVYNLALVSCATGSSTAGDH